MKTSTMPLFIPPAPPVIKKTSFTEVQSADEIADLVQIEISLERLLETYNLNKKSKPNRRVWHEVDA